MSIPRHEDREINNALTKARYFQSYDKPENLSDTNRDEWENREKLIEIIEGLIEHRDAAIAKGSKMQDMLMDSW